MKYYLISLLSLLLCVGCQSTTSMADGQKDHEGIQQIVAGQKLSIDEIYDIDGNVFSLQNSSNKKLIILFATWCPDSNRALLALNDSPILNDDSIDIIAVAREETIDDVKAWQKKRQLNIRFAADPKRDIYNQFASKGIPIFVMVSQDNYLVDKQLAEGTNQLELIKWDKSH